MAVTVPVVLWGAWRLMNDQEFQLLGTFVSRVEVTSPLVALTIDDGPGESVWELLRTLDAVNVRATFFVNGLALSEDPRKGRALISAGHELGNHTFSHRRMIFRSQGFIGNEIERTDALIQQAGQRGPILFRPPYGKKLLALPYYLMRTRRVSVMADIQPDSRRRLRDAAAMVRYTLDETKPGSIVLLHALGLRASHDAIPGIVAGLRSRGYRFVTTSELLAEASTASSQ